MSVPEHLWRFPTRAAIDALANRFGLPNHPGMQDWEFQVADPARIDEFLRAYESEDLSDDERFTLMEIILESFEDLGLSRTERDPRWERVLEILDRNIDLHASSVWYRSLLEEDSEDSEELFCVTPFLRDILAKHRSRLERSSELELCYGTILVGTVAEPFRSDDTWHGNFRASMRDEDGELQRLLGEFIRLSEAWNERLRRGEAADAAEFDAYSDLLTSGLWSIRRHDGQMFHISEAPVFLLGGELSWRNDTSR